MRITTLMDHDVTTGLLWDFVRDWFRYNVWGRRPWRPGRKGIRLPLGAPLSGPVDAATSFREKQDQFVSKLIEYGWEDIGQDTWGNTIWTKRESQTWDPATKPFSPVMDLELTEEEAKEFYGDWVLPDDPFDPAGWDLENMWKEWERTQGCDGCKGDCCGD